MSDGKQISVVVVDDHPVYRDGISRGLSLSGEIEVLAEAETGREAISLIREKNPDVAIVDYRLPDLDGIAVMRFIVQEKTLKTRVLILSATTESSVVFQAIEDGASGYLPKDARRAEIVEAVINLSRGMTIIPTELTGALAAQIRVRAKRDAPVLTERERQVLEAFSRGLSIPQTAEELFLGSATVKTHAQHLYEKLQVSDRAAAVAMAMRHGILQ
ncbi:response regulator [Streptomyces sp. NPDC127084]|uniref:response regulator n=1 Tax=Streptomyces sp. NPDC127084 TaxID=3347133 RepID=UPI00364F4115